MSLSYKPNHCDNCNRKQAGSHTGFQCLLFFILLCLFVIPGVLYYFLETPSRCYICGLKKRHKKEKSS